MIWVTRPLATADAENERANGVLSADDAALESMLISVLGMR